MKSSGIGFATLPSPHIHVIEAFDGMEAPAGIEILNVTVPAIQQINTTVHSHIQLEYMELCLSGQ